MSAQTQLKAKYGMPGPKYQAKFCDIWAVHDDFPWFPATHFLINTDFQALLTKAFTALQKKKLHTEIRTYDGCYNDRMVRGFTGTPSLHDWAVAIDLNAAFNPMVPNPKPKDRQGNWSVDFIATMKGAGVFYGGDFIHRADAMHWALLDG